MNVLSLFDGMSCGQIALNNAGVDYLNYFASEIDNNAIKVTQHNYPKTIQLGDICKIKIKLLSLLDVHQYLSVYDINIQSKLPEWEMLYWLDKKFTITAYFGAQIQNDGQKKVRESSVLQRIEKIRFSKRDLEDFVKSRNISGSGSNGNKVDSGDSNELQCGEWGYGYDMERRNFSKNIRGIEEKQTNSIRRNKKENFNNIIGEIFRPEGKTIDFGENSESNVARGCEKELFGESKENRYGGEVKKENGNGEFETNRNVQNPIEDLQKWNEINRTSKTYKNFIQFHSETQVTLVEYEGGIILFNGKFELICGGNQQKKVLEPGIIRRVRKLTPLEYERLQTIPDGYTSIVSDGARYKMLGNGWTCDVISFIFSSLR